MTHVRSIAAIGALLLGFALAGCSTPSASTSASSASAAVESTPSATTADLRPWASVISQESARLKDQTDKLDEDSCTAGSAGAMPCGALYIAQDFVLQTVALDLDSASNPSAKTYIGEVPAEIASLYSETNAAAAAATEASAKWSSKCIGSTSIKCHGIAFQVDTAVSDLSSQFDAWQPYL